MKTRMRRTWISVTLAAGSLALPFSGLRAHDLPTRWTSGAYSNPSWNYLLDECLDTPTLPATHSSVDVERMDRRGTEDWASSCPVEMAATGLARQALDIEADQLFRNPISRFSKEMTCWVNEWQMIQRTAQPVARAKPLWAALPDVGNPPAPDYSIEHFAVYEPRLLSDTCAFDAEFQARQTAAELLAKEIARAAEIARCEARLSQTIADAEQASAIVAADALPIAADQSNHFAALNHGTPSLCGGEDHEILSARCFPNRFAPGIVDEYIAYDMDARDQHWLGGLGKSWKLRSALAAMPAANPIVTADDAIVADESDEEDFVAAELQAWAEPAEELSSAPESFVAPDRVVAIDEAANNEALYDTSYGDNSHDDTSYEPAASNLAEQSAQSDAELRAYLDRLVHSAQQRALTMLQQAAESAEPDTLAAAESYAEESYAEESYAEESYAEELTEALPETMPDLGHTLTVAMEWMDGQQCSLASEMCGFDSAYRAGAWLADQSLAVAETSAQSLIEIGHYLDLPAADLDNQAGLEVYVIYVDSEGNSLAVPSSLARAWNRPESDADPSETTTEAAAADVASDAVSEVAQATAESFDWELVDAVGTQVVSMLANQLDSIGMRLLQASDFLSSWADTQIASRKGSSVR